MLPVTKFHPVALVRDLYELGVREVAENRHQEACTKAAELANLSGLRWHYIGQLQTNKVRQVVEYASSIHSVDRVKLVDALERALADRVEAGAALAAGFAACENTSVAQSACAEKAAPADAAPAAGPHLTVFAQVNLTDNPQRAGARPEEIESLCEHIANTKHLHLAGLMAVAPLDEPPAAAFERLARYAERVRAIVPTARALSAGMSHDFAEAIAYGATHLRIGTAITGKRPH